MVKISAILFSPDDATPPPALTEWLGRQADVVLTISDEDELMNLPAAEYKEWRAFWTDVDAFLAKSE